jgi:hypothetical protein
MRAPLRIVRKLPLAFLPATLLALSLAAPARAEDAVKSVWQVQEIHFPYFGLTTQYSCDGLRDRMQDILSTLGSQAVVSRGACSEISGPSKNPSLRILIANPVPAQDHTPDAKQAAKRADWVARIEKRNKVTLGDAPFDAVPKKVVLNTKGRDLSSTASGDCELLEQTRRQVFPKIGVKVLKDQVRCTPYQGTPTNQTMEVEVLAPAAT